MNEHVAGKFIGENILRLLAQFLVDHKNPMLQHQTFKTIWAALFLQVNDQRAKKRVESLAEGSLWKIGIVSHIVKVFRERRRHLSLTTIVDIQAHLHARITDQDILNCCKTLWDCGMQNSSVLFNLCTLAEFLTTHATACRFDQMNNSFFRHLFAYKLKGVGVKVQGAPALATITNGGKANKNGHVIYTSMLMHVNPLRCATAALGAYFLWRFLVMSEPFPDLLEPKSYYFRPIFRSGLDFNQKTGYDSAYDRFKRLYHQHSILCGKVVHEGRVKVQDDNQSAQISREDNDAFCNADRSEVKASYQLGVPLGPQVLQAGADHRLPHEYGAPHHDADADKCVNVLVPALAREEARIHALREQVTSDQGHQGINTALHHPSLNHSVPGCSIV